VIWLAWRQRRGTVIWLAIALVVGAALLIVTGRSMWGTFEGDGLAACLDSLGEARWVPVDGGCRDLADAFASNAFTMRLLGLVAFTFVPLAIGVALGAPLVARELEQDTVSIVWTQGVTRRRWAWSHLAVAAAITVVAAGTFAVLVTWWNGPINAATGDRFQWLIYDQQGSVPVGYAVFAMALGALAGAVTRRTLRAIAVTVAAFIAVRAIVAIVARPRFQPPVERIYAVIGDRVPNRLAGDWIYGGGGPGVGVVLRANGERIAGGQRVCPPPDAACVAEVGRGAFNLELIHPADRFWTFQAIETAVFVALALALAALTVWWIQRRRS
jgi:hypothetical protein